MTNNFHIIKDLLQFDNENDFYFVQILKRKKDNPEMKKDVSVIDTFFLYTAEDLFKLDEKIVELCVSKNARAYIRMNRRNAEKIALQTLKLTTDCILNKDFKNVKSAYLSACGQYASEPNKKWMIDIDKPEDKDVVSEFLNSNNIKVYGFIPSRSCGHFLVGPFNPNIFTNQFPDIDLNKDGTVNLYIP